MPCSRTWLREGVAGSTTGVVLVIHAVTTAALLVPGQLAPLLPAALGLSLLAAALAAIWLAWRSQLPYACGGPDSASISILAAMAAALAARGLEPGPHLLLLVMLTTLWCAVLFLILGYGRLGMAVRHVPFPVVGGFLASTGWLVCSGAVRVAGNPPPGATGLSLLWADGADPKVLLTLGLGVVFWLLLRRYRQIYMLPLLIVSATALVTGGILLSGLSLEQARAQGWLFDLATPATWSPPWQLPGRLADYDWVWYASLLPQILSLSAVATLAILLASSALEVLTRSDVSLDRELRTHGWMNLIGALLGLVPGGISISRSKVLQDSGARTRWAGVVAGGICLLGAAGAAGVLGWVPKPVLAAYLLSIGLGILWEWVVRRRQTMNPVDWAMVLVILATTIFFSFMVAVVVGILGCCLNFALSYSRVGVVQHDMDGADVRSAVLRPAAQRALLREKRGEIRVLVLRGVIFFGTASTLLERLRPLLASGSGTRALVLDFTHVASTDSSAGLTFGKIAQLAERAGLALLVSGATPAVRAALQEHPGVQWFLTVDQALDQAEEIVLRAHGADPGTTHDPLPAWLAAEIGPQHWERLAPLLERRELATGEVLLRQGDPSDETLYLVESGRLLVTLEGQAAGQRLASLMAGNIIGEMALYTQARRSATVTAEQPCVIWQLARERLEALQASAPDTAWQVHSLVVRTIAERVRQANATIGALQRGA